MKYPLVSIVGTTASGKTAAALQIAKYAVETKQYSRVHLISADSRQVYAALPILSGADIPSTFSPVDTTDVYEFPYFQNQDGTILLHGVSMLSLFDEWSVALFRELALRIMHSAVGRNELVIVVGGTGLYHRHILQTDASLLVPPDFTWRKEAATLSVSALAEILTSISKEKMAALNNSDSHNPRRLQRAIEVARAEKRRIPAWQQTVISGYSQYYIGLHSPRSNLAQRIEKRVEERLSQGVGAEVARILKKTKVLPTSVSSTLGFSQIVAVVTHKMNQDEARAAWIQAELQYSKRQLVWWKKQPQVQWQTSPLDVQRILESISK